MRQGRGGEARDEGDAESGAAESQACWPVTDGERHHRLRDTWPGTELPATVSRTPRACRENFAFHSPGGLDTDYAGLTEYFRSLRAAFDDRTIRRGIIVAEGEYIACQTWIEGTFVHPFTQSPAGRLEPTGARVVMDLMNIFRFDDEGRLVEEYVRTDYRSFLRQLGAEGA